MNRLACVGFIVLAMVGVLVLDAAARNTNSSGSIAELASDFGIVSVSRLPASFVSALTSQLQNSCEAQEIQPGTAAGTAGTAGIAGENAATNDSNATDNSATASSASADRVSPEKTGRGASTAAPGASESKGKSTFWTIVGAGGTIGFVLLGLSIAALTIAIDVLRSLRRSVFMPEGLAADVRELLNRGQLLAADQRCRQTPCCLSYVINAGLAESDGDWPDIEKTLEDSMAEQSSRYVRKIETLSVIGNIAPMLGLLGTVVGMVYAFRLLADTQGTPRPSDLAQGIYLALVTTVEGLIVAIPSLAAFAWFRNKIDQLMTEVAFQTQHVFLPLKRQIRANKRPAALQQPPRQPGKQPPLA